MSVRYRIFYAQDDAMTSCEAELVEEIGEECYEDATYRLEERPGDGRRPLSHYLCKEHTNVLKAKAVAL